MVTMRRLRVGWDGIPGMPGVSTFYYGPSSPNVSDCVTLFTAIKGLFPPGLTWTIPSFGDELESTTGQLTGAWAGSGGGQVASSGSLGAYAAGVGALARWDTLTIHNGRRVQFPYSYHSGGLQWRTDFQSPSHWQSLLALVLSSVAAAAIRTGQDDYAPGSAVTISGDNSDGAGFQAGESIHVDVSGPDGQSLSCDATADSEGAWSCDVTVGSDASAAGTYQYTATGAEFGVSQNGSFTVSAPPPTVEPTQQPTAEPTLDPRRLLRRRQRPRRPSSHFSTYSSSHRRSNRSAY